MKGLLKGAFTFYQMPEGVPWFLSYNPSLYPPYQPWEDHRFYAKAPASVSNDLGWPVYVLGSGPLLYGRTNAYFEWLMPN